MALGQEVKLTGMTARVTALTPDGRPGAATFRFDEPLESPSFVWLCFRGNSYQPFVLPAVGEEIEIPFDWRALFAPRRTNDPPRVNGSGQRLFGGAR